MKYLCLAYYNEEKFSQMPKNEVDALVEQCQTRDKDLQASGNLLMVGSLASPQVSANLRPQNGTPIITDGPYVETKEQVGAFFIIDAHDLNDAIRVASKHPAAQLGEHVGWGIEVRAIEMFQQA